MTDTQILQQLAEGKSVKQIAAQAKVTKASMDQRLYRMRKRGEFINLVHMVAENIGNVNKLTHAINPAWVS